MRSNLVAGILGNGLFRLEDLTKTVGQLSPGQRRKLELARLIAEGPNMLLLDEPTNYISLDVLEAFEAAVRDFPGPVLAVSHDRWFLRRFGGEVWELVDGTLTIHPAGTTVPWAQEASVVRHSSDQHVAIRGKVRCSAPLPRGVAGL